MMASRIDPEILLVEPRPAAIVGTKDGEEATLELDVELQM